MRNLLFICTLNRVRSLTAEHHFSERLGYSVRSAGTQANARVVLGYSLLHWADLIFVMERNHKEKILKQFPEVTREKKIVVLDIPNGFEYMDPELVSMLDRVVLPYLH